MPFTPSQPMNLDELRAAVAPVLAGAEFVVAFGSVVTGRFGRDSDIDLAVSYPAQMTASEWIERAANLSELCGRTVDLVDLKAADPIIAMQILRRGTPLIIRDQRAWEEFRMTTPSRYFDWKISRRPVELAMWADAGRG